MALTPRQKEIQDLVKQGKTAPQIAEALGISDNAVYQQLRKMKGGAGAKAKANSAKKASGSGSKAKASNARRKSAAKARAAAAAPKPAPAPAPAPAEVPKLPTLLQHARAEVKTAEDAIKAQAKVIEDAEKAIEGAKAKIADLTVERDRKKDLVAVLTGEKRAVNIPTPKAAKTPDTAKGSSETAKAAGTAQSAPSAPESGTNGTASSAPAEPSTQAEREAAAEHDGTAEQPVAA